MVDKSYYTLIKIKTPSRSLSKIIIQHEISIERHATRLEHMLVVVVERNSSRYC